MTGYWVRLIGVIVARLIGPYAYQHRAYRIYRVVRYSFGRIVVRCQRQGWVRVVMQ